ncbi:MAG: RidA family protein [Deltaproteobacteria bacterium]|jgi:enamine deaminase RidA (YjgF/YER057c/UK114 family)|nr:RidA family protein [Deltaproteobacteria bacterium]
MKTLEHVQPADWAAPRGYSNGVVAPYGRRLLAVAGQVGWRPDATMVTPAAGEDAFVAQFRQALANVATIVRTAGGELTDVMSLRLYVIDKRHYLACTRELGRVYREIFGKHYPAMALIVVAGLLEDSALLEIEALAAIP